MLWRAGQERLERERRARMGELFLAVRDAQLDADVATGRIKPRGTWRLPSYLRDDADVEQRNSPAERDRALAALGLQFPGIVKGRPA